MFATATYKELWRVKGSGREEKWKLGVEWITVGTNGMSQVLLVFRVQYGISILKGITLNRGINITLDGIRGRTIEYF